MAIPKPASHLDWTDGAAAKVVEPDSAKKLLGWVALERPPFEFMNFLFFRTDGWLKYLECVTDGVNEGNFDSIVGAGVGATHATLQAAIDDGAVPAGSRILIKDNFVVVSDITVTKTNLRLEFKPGVTYSNGGATFGLDITAPGTEIQGGRFTGFGGGGEAAINFSAAGANDGLAFGTRFSGNTDDILDTVPTRQPAVSAIRPE